MNDTFIFKATIKTAGSGKNSETGEQYNYVVFTPEKNKTTAEFMNAIVKAYEGNKKQYVPKWLDSMDENITAKSTFAIPVLVDEERMNFADWVSRGVRDAEVSIKCKVSGGVYCNAIKEIKQGVEFNPFDGM